MPNNCNNLLKWRCLIPRFELRLSLNYLFIVWFTSQSPHIIVFRLFKLSSRKKKRKEKKEEGNERWKFMSELLLDRIQLHAWVNRHACARAFTCIKQYFVSYVRARVRWKYNNGRPRENSWFERITSHYTAILCNYSVISSRRYYLVSSHGILINN